MKNKTKTLPMPPRPEAGHAIAEEIERLTEGFTLDYIQDHYCCHVTVDLEHNCEAHWMIAIYDCNGNVAKQLVAECERIAGVYQRLAQTVKERIYQDHMKEHGDRLVPREAAA